MELDYTYEDNYLETREKYLVPKAPRVCLGSRKILERPRKTGVQLPDDHRSVSK